jgi:hypothetical protein
MRLSLFWQKRRPLLSRAARSKPIGNKEAQDRENVKEGQDQENAQGTKTIKIKKTYRKKRRVPPGLAFETWDPAGKCPSGPLL